MEQIKATHYSEMEGCLVKPFPFEFTKEDLKNPFQYDFGFNHEYSEVLGQWVKGMVMFIKTIKCFSIYFEDDSVYSCHRKEFRK